MQGIIFTVIGIEGEDVLVHCQYGDREWNDILDVSLFNSEIKELH